MRLYFNKYTRATRPRWVIEEAGIPCEIVNVDMAAGAHRTPEYTALHPHGKVPVLVDDGRAIMESAAICLYLADRYPAAGLAPPVDSPLRALYYQWSIYAVVTLEPPVAEFFAQSRKPESERDAAAVAGATERFRACAEVLSAALSDRTWLVGDRFSTADVLIGGVLAWADGMKMCEGMPVLQRYVGACKARPAFRAART